MNEQEFTDKELVAMIKRLHNDNQHDTVFGIREGSDFIALKRIHERNNAIFLLLRELKL